MHLHSSSPPLLVYDLLVFFLQVPDTPHKPGTPLALSSYMFLPWVTSHSTQNALPGAFSEAPLFRKIFYTIDFLGHFWVWLLYSSYSFSPQTHILSRHICDPSSAIFLLSFGHFSPCQHIQFHEVFLIILTKWQACFFITGLASQKPFLLWDIPETVHHVTE